MTRIAMTPAAAQRTNHVVIGGVRIITALLWLANLHWKVPPAFGEDTGGGLYKYVESVTRHSPFAPYTWVVEEAVLPNFRLFGWITLVVESLIALLLLVGYRTRPAALAGAGATRRKSASSEREATSPIGLPASTARRRSRRRATSRSE